MLCGAKHPERDLICRTEGTHRDHCAYAGEIGRSEVIYWPNADYRDPPPRLTQSAERTQKLLGLKDSVTPESKVGPLDVSGMALKQRGIEQANQHAQIEWAQAFDQAVITLAKEGVIFTSEDACVIAGRPDHPNRVGARMNALAQRGIIKRVDFAQAERPNQHAALISRWQGTGKSP
jgi:hypothetical protein